MDSAPSVPPKPTTINKPSRPASPPPLPVKNATTARQTNVRALSAKPTPEVSRVPSLIMNHKLLFPLIPPDNECPYCGVIIEFKGMAEWHNHVMEDLKPFIFVFPRCLEAGQHGTGPQTFETTKAWINHMQDVHGQAWECRALWHNLILFDQEMEYQEPVIKEHGAPEEHVGPLSKIARRRGLFAKKLECCPFGNDFQHPKESESSDVFSSEPLQAHVAAHMAQVGLLALQRDVDGNSEKVDGAQPWEDDGSGLTKLREFYRVLADKGQDL